ncbi:unnamed protein product [Rotaria sordida]|uniref:Uncharacterized protein n=1 Tax=Rotaria sordida TaxID=392033 RepID=A0A820GIB4_9BILA|nr:unnamed protein product [Rotaria sordida]
MHAMFNNYHGANYGYSETVCYQICGQVYAHKQCGCVNPNPWSTHSVILPGTDKIILLPLCNASNTYYTKVVDTLLASSILMNKYCSDCSQQCLITNFIIQTSSLTTPVEWQMYEIKGFVENSTIPLPNNWTTTWREHIRENYLAVNVVRETNIVENNTQTAIFGVVDILSNIGGQTGLWIGISFRSIMEVFEMLYRLICYQYFLIVRAVRKKKQIIIQ